MGCALVSKHAARSLLHSSTFAERIGHCRTDVQAEETSVIGATRKVKRQAFTYSKSEKLTSPEGQNRVSGAGIEGHVPGSLNLGV